MSSGRRPLLVAAADRRVLVALVLVGVLLGGSRLAGQAGGSTPTATPAVAPLVVDGDPIGSLVPASPEAAAVYAVGGEGLYRSEDGGASWQAVGPPPPPGQLVAAVDSPLVLLAGAHPPCARGGGELVPLQRSEDGGANWAVVEGAAGIRPLAIWTEANLALGASCAGLQLSTDAGLTWGPASSIEPGYDISAFAPLAGAKPSAPAGLVAGTSEGGTTRVWRLGLSDPARPTAGEGLVGFWGGGSLAGRDRLYVVGAAAGVLVSTDGGEEWQSSRDGLEDVTLSVDPLQEAIPEAELSRGYGIDAVAIDPGQPKHLYAGTVDGLYESTDQGATWQRVPGVEGWVTRLVLAPASDRVLVQTEAGVVVLRPR